jgi:parallel beta-helix repeat protein
MHQGPDSYAINNGFNGVELDMCDDSAIWWFTATTNGKNDERSGISLDTSDNVDVMYSTAEGNSRNGIRVADDSDGGNLGGNSAFDNDEYDLYQESGSTNTWVSNSFGTKFGF